MSDRARLPGGEPRKASQRNKRNVSSSGAAKIPPTWQPGARVHWKDRVGTFRRDLGDGEHRATRAGRVRERHLAGRRRAPIPPAWSAKPIAQ